MDMQRKFIRTLSHFIVVRNSFWLKFYSGSISYLSYIVFRRLEESHHLHQDGKRQWINWVMIIGLSICKLFQSLPPQSYFPIHVEFESIKLRWLSGLSLVYRFAWQIPRKVPKFLVAVHSLWMILCRVLTQPSSLPERDPWKVTEAKPSKPLKKFQWNTLALVSHADQASSLVFFGILWSVTRSSLPLESGSENPVRQKRMGVSPRAFSTPETLFVQNRVKCVGVWGQNLTNCLPCLLWYHKNLNLSGIIATILAHLTSKVQQLPLDPTLWS